MLNTPKNHLIILLSLIPALAPLPALQANQGLPALNSVALLSTIAGISTFNTENPRLIKYLLSGGGCALGYSVLDRINQGQFTLTNLGQNMQGVAYTAIAAGVLAYLASMRGAVKDEANFSFNGSNPVHIAEYPVYLKRFAAWAAFTGALAGGILAHRLSN